MGVRRRLVAPLVHAPHGLCTPRHHHTPTALPPHSYRDHTADQQRSEHAPTARLAPWNPRRDRDPIARPMPSAYDPNTALPLKVPAELRARLDAVTARLPATLKLPRNSVAVAALVVGLDALSRDLAGDAMAVHRVLAGDALPGTPPPASTPTPARAALDGDTVRGTRDTVGARAPRTAPRPSRATRPKRPRAPTPTAARDGGALETPDAPDAPDAATVRELLTTVLQLGASTAPGGRGWTVKGLAAAVGCDRRAVQVFRDRGEGMGRPLQLKLWNALRGDAPVKG